jgi:hypothetical protein
MVPKVFTIVTLALDATSFTKINSSLEFFLLTFYMPHIESVA